MVVDIWTEAVMVLPEMVMPLLFRLKNVPDPDIFWCLNQNSYENGFDSAPCIIRVLIGRVNPDPVIIWAPTPWATIGFTVAIPPTIVALLPYPDWSR